MAFGEEVRLARERLGWTQNRLAREAGINQPTLQRIERSPNRDPQLSFAVKIAQALGVPVEVLVGATQPAFSVPGGETEVRLPEDLGIALGALRAKLQEVEALARKAQATADEVRSLIPRRSSKTA